MPLQTVDFTLPETPNEVSVVLSAPWALFCALITPETKSSFYRQHRIPRKNPKPGATHRVVWQCANDEVASLHRAFARRFQQFIGTRSNLSSIAHGYVPKRSTVTNATVHAGARLLLRLDIAEFFPSITAAQVQDALISAGIQARAAGALAQFSTIHDALPLGLHASPVIANLICTEMDQELLRLAEAFGCRVTRYADDIAFSGDRVPALDDAIRVIQQYDFTVARSKCRLTKRGQSHYVTGLSISESSPKLPRTVKRRIRQELYFITKFGLSAHLGRRGDASVQAGVNRIDGTLRYFNAVEPPLAARIRPVWNSILRTEGLGPAYHPQAGAPVRAPVTLFVDETDIPSPDGQVLAIGMTLIVDIGLVETSLAKVEREHLIDPYSTGNKSKLATTGLHYSENSEDLHTSVFKALETLPLRSYVAYDMVSCADEYRATYEKLLRGLLGHRFRFCSGAEVALVIEQNSKLDLSALRAIVRDEFEKLARSNDRRPSTLPTLRFGTKKGDPCLAASDFILAAVRQYATVESQGAPSKNKGRSPGELAKKRFERLRDKIRLVRALPIHRNFSRKDPFLPWSSGRPTILREP